MKLASINGHTYKPLDQLFENPTEFMETVSGWKKSGSPKGSEFQSYFSTTSPTIKLSELVAFYEQDHIHELAPLNDRERSKKINPLHNAVKQLIGFLEKDIELKSLTRVQARGFQTSLKNDIATKKSKPIPPANTLHI